MLWYVFVWFYLVTDHAPWWVYVIAFYATLRDAYVEMRDK